MRIYYPVWFEQKKCKTLLYLQRKKKRNLWSMFAGFLLDRRRQPAGELGRVDHSGRLGVAGQVLVLLATSGGRSLPGVCHRARVRASFGEVFARIQKP